MIVIDFIADLPLVETWCAFNVLRTQGKHRQCDDYARERVGSYDFCKRHAKIVRAALEAQEGE